MNNIINFPTNRTVSPLWHPRNPRKSGWRVLATNGCVIDMFRPINLINAAERLGLSYAGRHLVHKGEFVPNRKTESWSYVTEHFEAWFAGGHTLVFDFYEKTALADGYTLSAVSRAIASALAIAETVREVQG